MDTAGCQSFCRGHRHRCANPIIDSRRKNASLADEIKAEHEENPFAGQESISLGQLENYPCLSFEQGDNSSFYFAEEILSTNEYPQTIKANDRATMLNLMVGLNGYTLCSGIICEELNGNDYVAVPFREDEQNLSSSMEIGYVTRKNMTLSRVGELYIEKLKKYLDNT